MICLFSLISITINCYYCYNYTKQVIESKHINILIIYKIVINKKLKEINIKDRSYYHVDNPLMLTVLFLRANISRKRIKIFSLTMSDMKHHMDKAIVYCFS